MKKLMNIDGFGLIEVTIIIITIGILASIAMQSMTALMTDARQVKTEREMELLTDAIVGNADITAGTKRADFGYIGDVGAFPPNLDALITNPGGYTTWDGPYISREFTQDTDGYKTDEWGTTYSYSGGLTINSTGSGSSITKKIADAASDYTLNNFNGTVLDASGTVPGTTYLDSVNIKITIPNGSGGTTTKSYLADSSGSFSLDSLPVGQHPLQIIYTPDVDTLYSVLTILPRHKTERTYKFASSYFTSSGGGGGGSSGVETLRPNGIGSSTDLVSVSCSNNWECVDEVASDDNGTYNRGNGNSWRYDLYAVTNSAVAAGTIDSVKVYIYVIGNGGNQRGSTYIRTNSNNYSSSQINLSSSYATYSTLYITNPQTSSAWTWTEIEALQIGAGLRREARLTQTWVEVYYTN